MGATHNRCDKSFIRLVFFPLSRSNKLLERLSILSLRQCYMLRSAAIECALLGFEARDVARQCARRAHEMGRNDGDRDSQIQPWDRPQTVRPNHGQTVVGDKSCDSPLIRIARMQSTFAPHRATHAGAGAAQHDKGATFEQLGRTVIHA